MSPLQLIFLIASGVTLYSAVMVVTTRRMLHAALWLILSLFGVAVLFATLESGFFAVIQVVVYIGAIAILVIFAVMLTRRVMEDTGPQVNANWIVAGIVSVGMLVGLGGILIPWQGLGAFAVAYPADVQALTINQLGQALVSPQGYALPFEAASVLLLAALIGAIYVAWERK
ncbi:MAG TPA: NADH-quinone oxidoreductase subunit J [Anaerolineaceae bacterium]|jgi:NADH-quinone oxidoreductase subunit J